MPSADGPAAPITRGLERLIQPLREQTQVAPGANLPTLRPAAPSCRGHQAVQRPVVHRGGSSTWRRISRSAATTSAPRGMGVMPRGPPANGGSLKWSLGRVSKPLRSA